MAAIVFVHGIDNQGEGPDLIDTAWLPALSGSVRLAGRSDLADRLCTRPQPDGIECRAAFYGNLFRSNDVEMGADVDLRELTTEQENLTKALSLEWLERVAQRAPAESSDAVQARRTLEILRDPDAAQAMGYGNVLREAINALCKVSWIAKLGYLVAERFVVTALAQVSRYLTDGTMRNKVQAAMLKHVKADTRVVIGHSLGSVVAYECAHLLTHPLPLLVTIGSPLGLRTIVTDRLRPPPSFPSRVTVWLNVANREDVVAAEPNLCPLFANDVPATSRFDGVSFDEPCANPHDPKIYLGREPVGRAVIQALA